MHLSAGLCSDTPSGINGPSVWTKTMQPPPPSSDRFAPETKATPVLTSAPDEKPVCYTERSSLYSCV